jgi:hypothetical protein
LDGDHWGHRLSPLSFCVFAKCRRHLGERSEPQTRCYTPFEIV